MTTIVETMGNHQAPPAGMMFPPSHLTRAQVARILKLSTTRVYVLAKKGGRLEAETWHGTPMIPTWRVLNELRRKLEGKPCR